MQQLRLPLISCESEKCDVRTTRRSSRIPQSSGPIRGRHAVPTALTKRSVEVDRPVRLLIAGNVRDSNRTRLYIEFLRVLRPYIVQVVGV